MKLSLYILLLLSFTSFNNVNYLDDDDGKTIHLSDENYKYTIQIINKELKTTLPDRMYYWYKAQEIHNSIGEYDGQLLNGKYTKNYKSNQLAEKGYFKKGLKKDKWTKWYENGNIKKNISWRSGVKSGMYEEFNSNGKKILTGNYRSNLKSGMWIDFIKSDTLYYKKGELLKDKPLSFPIKVSVFFKKVFLKKEKSLEKKDKNKKGSKNKKLAKKNRK